MKAPCLFVAPGFEFENVSLQPWRYIHELTLYFSKSRSVVVLTEGAGQDLEYCKENITIIRSPMLSILRQYSLALRINQLSPSEIWWSTTPRSIAYAPCWNHLRAPLTALITCPLYPWSTLLQAKKVGRVPYRELRSLMQQRLIPRRCFSAFLSNPIVNRIVTQSQANRKMLEGFGVPSYRIDVIPVGLDRRELSGISTDQADTARNHLGFPSDSFIFLYLGAIRQVRGINQLLEAFFIAAKNNPRICLAILGRAANFEECNAIVKRCRLAGLEKRVRVLGGWMDRGAIWAHIIACDAVTLPFIVVPSDVPVAVLEALSCGKPVIGTNVDGIPELVQGRGLIVEPLDRDALAGALLTMSDPNGPYFKFSDSARSFAETYLGWDDVGQMAMFGNRDNRQF